MQVAHFKVASSKSVHLFNETLNSCLIVNLFILSLECCDYKKPFRLMKIYEQHTSGRDVNLLNYYVELAYGFFAVKTSKLNESAWNPCNICQDGACKLLSS